MVPGYPHYTGGPPDVTGFSGPQVVGVRCPGVPKPPHWRPFAAVTLTDRHSTIVITLTDGLSRIILCIVIRNICEKDHIV